MHTLKVVRWTLALAVGLAILAACGEDHPVQPPATPAPLLPFAVGTRWTYVDSLVTSIGTWVDIDTVLVVGARTEGGDTWYELAGSFNPSIAASEFMVRSDSVYSLQHTEVPGGLGSIVSLEYIRPQGTETLTYNSVFDGDVLLVKSVSELNQTYTVPAGSCTDCALFEYPIWPERYREFLKPGVGILSWEVEADSSVYGPAWSRKRKLVDYRVGVR